MKLTCDWQGGLASKAVARGHEAAMDAKTPLGRDAAMTPKELVVAGLCGCTVVDIAAAMRKVGQAMDTLQVTADIEQRTGVSPVVFAAAKLHYIVTGSVHEALLLEAVAKSQGEDCGVSAMLVRSGMALTYEVTLNGRQIGRGVARFS